MTIRELINSKPSSITGVENFADYEVYRFTGSRHDLHTDFIEKIEEPSLDTEVEMWTLMDQNEYNNTVLANSSVPANFAEWYDDADAKVLVIIASRTEIRYIISAETFEAPYDTTWTTDELIEEYERQSWHNAEVIDELTDEDEARKAFEDEKNRAYTIKRQGVAGAYLEVKIIMLEAAHYEDGELDHTDELDVYAEPFCDEDELDENADKKQEEIVIEISRIKIKTETFCTPWEGQLYCIDICEDSDERTAWLYNSGYGIKMLMFGESAENDRKEFLDTVFSNLPEYIELYIELYED